MIENEETVLRSGLVCENKWRTDVQAYETWCLVLACEDQVNVSRSSENGGPKPRNEWRQVIPIPVHISLTSLFRRLKELSLTKF